MEWWLLCWLVLFTRAQDQQNPCLGCCCQTSNDVPETERCMKEVFNILNNGSLNDAIDALEILEQTLEETSVSSTTSLYQSCIVAFIRKPRVHLKKCSEDRSEHRSKNCSQTFEMHVNTKETKEDEPVANSIVKVRVPRELDGNDTIVFCMISWPEASRVNLTASGKELHESRLISLSVRGKRVSGLQENVTISVTFPANETRIPSCEFFNFSTKNFSSDGCDTQWERGQSVVNCSCNHLTYFGVLLVSPSSSPDSVSATDLKIMSYITVIGCSLSLFALVVAVVLFITNRKLREDVSMKVHINLAIALLLLNLHFLPSEWVATLSSTGPCLYVALALHYSLLASFSWMALEGFHLYLLLVRVFNIYVRRYLLKLSVVGWGVPAVIVSLVAAVDIDAYGLVPLDSSDPNSTNVCYIVNTTVKMVTTVGVFSLVFVFNMIMLAVTVRRILGLPPSGEFGQKDRNRAQRDACTLLGVTTLLGLAWGLVFFSFGYLTTAGLYLFCILNPLQGFFIFLWFVMTWRKRGNPTPDSVTSTTNR